MHIFVLCCLHRCAHYGQSCCRSQGIRPNQRHFALDFPVKINISFNRQAQKLVVRELCLQHNHHIGTEIMMHYPNNHRLTTTESKEIENVLGLGGNKKLNNEEIQKKLEN